MLMGTAITVVLWAPERPVLGMLRNAAGTTRSSNRSRHGRRRECEGTLRRRPPRDVSAFGFAPFTRLRHQEMTMMQLACVKNLIMKTGPERPVRRNPGHATHGPGTEVPGRWPGPGWSNK